MLKRGADYVARKRLYVRDSASPNGWAAVAEAGETCERVPVSSLDWLEEQGHVERVAPQLEDDAEVDVVIPDDKEGE